MFNSYVGLPEGSKAIEEKGEHFLDRSVTTWSIALGSADTGGSTEGEGEETIMESYHQSSHTRTHTHTWLKDTKNQHAKE